MFRSRSPRLWSFQAALDDIAEALPDIGIGKKSGFSGLGVADFTTSLQRLNPTLNEIVAPQACGAPLKEVSRAYAGCMVSDRPETDGLVDGARELKEILSSKSRLTPKELQNIRRVFAKHYHPDCVPMHMRVAAEQNMAMMNAFVDGALEKKRAFRAECAQSTAADS